MAASKTGPNQLARTAKIGTAIVITTPAA